MPTISQRAGELVRYLQQSASLLERLTRRRLDSAALAELEELADVNTLPHLAALALMSDSESRRRITTVAVATWQRVPVASLVALDSAYRAMWWTPGTDSGPWDRLSPRDVEHLGNDNLDGWALVAVATFHARGHVRESAVRALDTTTTGSELPFLIVRLNDWVPQVADRARAAVMRRVNPAWTVAWARNLGVIQRLSAASRRDHTEVVNAVFDLLRQPESRPALELALTSDDQNVSRVAYRLAREAATGVDRLQIVRRAMSERDVVVRFDAVRASCESFDNETLAPLLEQAANDAFMPIRRRALAEAMERYPDIAGDRARYALLDRNPAVREVGRTWLAVHEPETSVAEFYRRQLKADVSSALVGSIAGLAETGEGADAALIEPLARDPRPRVRREAIRALGRLDAASHGAVFISALSDESPKVARAAREVLAANPSLIDYDTVRSTIADGRFAHSRIQAVRLASTLGKWTSVQLLLEAGRVLHPEVRTEVRDQLERWLASANLRFTAPKPAQVASIIELLNEQGPTADASVRERVRGFLGPWTPNASGG
jgi:HEAT repeat protein